MDDAEEAPSFYASYLQEIQSNTNGASHAMNHFRTLGDEGIRTYQKNEDTIHHEIDGDKATFRGKAVRTLGTEGRRKFENLVLLNHANKRKKQIFIYKP